MPEFWIEDLVIFAIAALACHYLVICLMTGGLKKDVRWLRKFWRDTDPNDNPDDRP